MNKKEKEAVVANLNEKFARAKAVVLTDYKGMTVAELSALRVSLRSSAVEFKVVKNTLAQIAAKGTPVETEKDVFTGPVGVAIGYDDPTIVPKRVFESAKGKDAKLKVLGGFVEGRLYDAADLKKIADLPSKEVLLSQIAGCFSAPMGKMAGLLDATISKMVNALNALKEKRSA
ncbi:50S ribosomal protein L10 [Candidatus Magnetominusculus xianensis]|uniref:Large ribosomal subunit protein uL10 n=1 Tax=Candidatus Magnetominusculus xianensis TaxID=1748249 RepID=A0ABR5SFZ0_9BACT|nr:50S ribosomal protein L10 [Candidatus Magnetominusculus xianensis]KWT86962.1 50S ribosomal protein L10 [Candidatus Magnetominusculus xianensis]MBF0403914.1 50S ribosomal protein L10 [Nitrospirota bacterium]